MSIPLPVYFTPHVVRVRAVVDGAGMGGSYAPERSVAAFASDEQKVVASDAGTEKLSTSQVTVNFDEQIPIGSLVTVWPGLTGEREAAVLAIARHQHATLPSFQTLSLE